MAATYFAETNKSICVESGTKLVLLFTGNIEWTVKQFYLSIESNEVREKQAFVYTIQQSGQLPHMEVKIHLERDNYISDNYHLKCTLVNEMKKLPEGGLFYKIKSDVMKEDGSVYQSNRSSLVQQIWNCKSQSLHSHTVTRRGYRPPLNTDGSLSFKIGFEIFLKEVFITQVVATGDTTARSTFTERFQAKAIMDLTTKLKLFDNTLVKIISKDNHEYLASRAVLQARSEVFDAMFCADLTESKTCVVRLDDLSSKAVAFLLEFIENGTAAHAAMEDLKDISFLEEVIYAADKYRILDLLDYFNKTLKECACEQNAVDLLRLANKFSLEEGKQQLKQFIQTNLNALDFI